MKLLDILRSSNVNDATSWNDVGVNGETVNAIRSATEISIIDKAVSTYEE